jgi:hypothetical protein
MKDNKESQEQQKLTYEQLNTICSELYQQNQALTKRLQEANLVNMFKRLDYLFTVIENANVIKDSEFINACIAEIKDAMMTPKNCPEETTKEEG